MLPLDRSYGHHFPLVASFGQAEHQESNDREFFYVEDSLVHLFFECDFSQNFWCKLSHEHDTSLPLNDMIVEGTGRQNSICFK
jgi:hypothetical protein